jgi:hypothetical protein
VRLPLSSRSRSQLTWAKLLRRVDPRSRSPFGWDGNFLRPGSSIRESDLWPDGSFPRMPLVLEFAGAENPARGHNRRNSDETVILWRYHRDAGKFLEFGRVAGPGAIWARLMEPLVMEAMREEMGFAPAPDFDLIRERIIRMLRAELDLIGDRDRARLLTLVHDELAGRIAEWSVTGIKGERFWDDQVW